MTKHLTLTGSLCGCDAAEQGDDVVEQDVRSGAACGLRDGVKTHVAAVRLSGPC
jgi:hypothetical protein